MSHVRNIAIVAGLSVAAIFAYVAWTAHEKRTQKQAIAALVAQGTSVLTKSLEGVPSAAEVAAAQQAANEISSASASRQRALARAADQYLASARIVVQRRAETRPMVQEAAASREALAKHVTSPGRRDEAWARNAAELKRKADQRHADLERALGALAELLDSLPKAEAELAQHLDRSILAPEPLIAAAARQAREEALRSAAELDRARRLAAR